MASILIVEDDCSIAEVMKLYLEKDGYQVQVAHDGSEGLTMA